MNQLVYFTDGDIQSQLATKYNLLIHVGKSSLRYMLVDFLKDQVKALARYELKGSNDNMLAAIQELPESSKLFKYSFNTVRISFDSFNYVLVPEDLYDPADEAAYRKFSSLGSTSTITNTIRPVRAKNIAEVSPEFRKAMEKIFQKPQFYNQATPFLEVSANLISSAKGATLFVDFGEGNVQIAVYKGLSLLFYNIFPVSQADEFNYFLLQVLEETGIDSRDTEVIISGEMKAGEEFDSRLSKYFTEVHPANASRILPFPEEAELSPHHFFSLSGLHLCE